MKGNQLRNAKLILDECNVYAGKTFVTAVYKTKKLIEKELELVESCLRNHPDGDIIEMERNLLFEYAEKDANGDVVSTNGNVKITDMGALNKKLVELHEKYAEFWDTYKELLDGDVSFDVPSVSEEHLPENINGKHYEALQEIGMIC